MIIISGLAIAIGAYMLLFTAANILYMTRMGRSEPLLNHPKVSVLIPARNEAERITPALAGLQNQDYQNFEVIILDDNSDDATSEVCQQEIQGDSRFSLIQGQPLPQGWKGKPYAMEQLREKAQGEILIYIDADMRPGPHFVTWTVEKMVAHRVDFLSGYAQHTAPDQKEYLLYPVMYLATAFLLPLWLFRHTKTYMFSHAIGQYFCVKQEVLNQTQGFYPVKDKINEDIQMARHLKACGFHQVFLDAKKHLSGNMYDSMEHAKMGIMRVVYEYFDNQVYPFVFMGAVMFTLLVLPLFLAPLGILLGEPWGIRCLIGCALVLMGWYVTLVNRQLPWWTALLYPIHFTWIIILSVRSIRLSKQGKGYSWKGRTVQ
ncbi:MAG: glycosyltransferase [Spirochaetales bacterium]|nr:glycosyltransferase [Spirochaetales bacterium]